MDTAPHLLAREAVAGFILDAPGGSVSALTGIGQGEVRLLLDAAEPTAGGRLAVAIAPTHAQADAIVGEALDVLARTALELWPVWFTDVDFAAFGRNATGHEAARLLVRGAVATVAGLSVPWAEAAVALALEGQAPRVPGTHPAVELAQLCLAINRHGLAIVVATPASAGAAFVHAVEWIAGTAGAPVVVLFEQAPAPVPPLDRLLYGARRVAPPDEPPQPADSAAPAWLAPVIGRPHPLSETEQRLAAALARDAELCRLFSFNQIVETVRGLRPKVDLVWPAGRLVVELDGYADHGTRGAFRHDRHRDYELLLTGYAVLRLANDEIAEDMEKALDKIRDVVRLRRNFT